MARLSHAAHATVILTLQLTCSGIIRACCLSLPKAQPAHSYYLSGYRPCRMTYSKVSSTRADAMDIDVDKQGPDIFKRHNEV